MRKAGTTAAPQTVLITGSRGFLGCAATPVLEAAGFRVLRAVRYPSSPLADDERAWNVETGHVSLRHGEQIDAVVHLAGRSLQDIYLSEAKVRALAKERRLQALALMRSVATWPAPPAVVVLASGVGFYTDTPRASPSSPSMTPLTDASPKGSGVLADMAAGIEESLLLLPSTTRTVVLRLGMIVAPHGGALKKMMLPFKLGMGGPLGHGRQVWPWISLADAARAVLFALDHETLQGPVNAVAPEVVTQRQFAHALGRALGRPAFMLLPAFMVKIMMGPAAAELLLSGVPVAPACLKAAGFTWVHDRLGPWLKGA
ncbi:MAG: TIGR01777 family protein [Alphaproteobacteria bacterium CG_4_10_14_0_8_um_filter_53_9]|nr:MAG: TIGR01777 family protein [Alphaproteobacteria bacterium CG_4_10_14_0_8_um_filter_53_9]